MLILILQYIDKFRNLAREIMGLASIEHFDMIRLDCEDLKRGLSDAAKGLADILLERVSTDHRNENKRYKKVNAWNLYNLLFLFSFSYKAVQVT